MTERCKKNNDTRLLASVRLQLDTDQYTMMLWLIVHVCRFNSFSSVTEIIGLGITGDSQTFLSPRPVRTVDFRVLVHLLSLYSTNDNILVSHFTE